MIEVTKEMVEKITFELLEKLKNSKRVFLDSSYAFICEKEINSRFDIEKQMEKIYINFLGNVDLATALKEKTYYIAFCMKFVKKLKEGEYIAKLFDYYFLIKLNLNERKGTGYDSGDKYGWFEMLYVNGNYIYDFRRVEKCEMYLLDEKEVIAYLI